MSTSDVAPVNRASDLDKFSNELHQNMWNNVTYGEQKAGFIFLAVSGLLVFLNQAGAPKQTLTPLCQWHAQNAFASLSLATLLTSATITVLVIWPRFPKDDDSVFYWRAIAEEDSAKAFVQKFAGKTRTELEDAVLTHCHQLAVVAHKKYRYLRYSLIAACVGACLTLLYAAVKS